MVTAEVGGKRRFFRRNGRGIPKGHWRLEVRITDLDYETVKDFYLRAENKVRAAAKAFRVVQSVLGKLITEACNPLIKARLHKMHGKANGNGTPTFVLHRACRNLGGALKATGPGRMFHEVSGGGKRAIH